VKDPNAPKRPATAYLLFCQEQREKMKQHYPNLNFSELTRELGYKWSEMPHEEKKKYIEEAERQREKYLRDFDEYQKSESYKQFMKSKFEGEFSGFVTSSFVQDEMDKGLKKDSSQDDRRCNSSDSPVIFTQEFLDHSKSLEEELKQLRQTSADLEESNSILSQHIEDLKSSIKVLEDEVVEQQSKNQVVKTHLDTIKVDLVTILQNHPLPTFPHVLDVSNIEEYLQELKSLWQREPDQYHDVVQRVKNVILGLQGV
jgi:isopenicillin N synthase-like dioxygenase